MKIFAIAWNLMWEVADWVMDHWLVTMMVLFVLPWGIDQLTDDHLAWNREHHGIGVCETLSEDAEVMVLFVNDRNSSWTPEKMESFITNQVDPALAYIEEQAASYGHTISLSRSYYTDDGVPQALECRFNITSYNGMLDLSRLTSRWVLGNVAMDLGYFPKYNMLADDRDYSGRKQVAYLICVNKPGRSFAIGQKMEVLLYNAMESAIIFAQDIYENPLGTATVAHELMHLFGADDYYAEGMKRNFRAKIAEEICPKDIMLGGTDDVNMRTVGRYTAYTLGWLDEMPEEYKQLGWWF